MKIHEYQAKELFSEYNIPIVKNGICVDNCEDAYEHAKTMKFPLVLKAQVHVGGRGKAGGVKLVDRLEDVKEIAENILSLTIKGLKVKKLFVVTAADMLKEVYLSLLIDRKTSGFIYVGCAEGGVEIEKTAVTNPEAILQLHLNYSEMIDPDKKIIRDFASKLFTEEKHINETVDLMINMGKLFISRDCSLVEINPLIIDGNNDVIALDAKILFDDNGFIRQKKNEILRDLDGEDLDELEAKKYGLSFIRLDGDIGCMVNGAGLAMATMDIIEHYGGRAANFLDVGGSSDPSKVVKAFELILKNPDVKSILINIFGGITRCDDIARGILTAFVTTEINIPIVIRLAGTNEKEGREMLKDTGLTIAETLEEGARLAIKMGSELK